MDFGSLTRIQRIAGPNQSLIISLYFRHNECSNLRRPEDGKWRFYVNFTLNGRGKIHEFSEYLCSFPLPTSWLILTLKTAPINQSNQKISSSFKNLSIAFHLCIVSFRKLSLKLGSVIRNFCLSSFPVYTPSSSLPRKWGPCPKMP